MKYNWLSFEEAKAFIHNLNLNNKKEWIKYSQSKNKPISIPAGPNIVYKNKGWISFTDWIGKKNFKRGEKKDWLSFNDARKFIHKLNLKTSTDWKKYCKSGKKPNNIPTNPNITYKNKGWISFDDWIGIMTDTKNFKRGEKKDWIPFEEAKAFIHNLNLNNTKDWQKYCKSNEKPNNIPCNPYNVYKNKGWISYSDWIGKNIAKKQNHWLSFNDAKKIVYKLNLKTSTDWKKYCKSGKKPNNIPTNPNRFYKNKGWISFDDWIGKKEKVILSFKELKSIIQEKNIKTIEQYRNLRKEYNF